MLNYLSRCHKALMEESEQALLTAAQEGSGIDRRIAKQILADSKVHGLWESRHADLVRPVAEHSSRVPQIIALRGVEVRLVHQQALVDHLRENRIHGAERERLFRVFYGPREFQDAVLAEHRQYMLAVSSRVSADHLINVMEDSQSRRLVRQYEVLYARYFELYCYVVGTEDAASADATRPLMTDLRKQAERVRHRINKQRPDGGAANFERQALLARSGRHKALNYLSS